MEYYVISLKWTVGSDYLVFWRANAAGYTVDIEQAGRYSQETITEQCGYYDDHKNTLAVPCEEIELLTWRVVDSGKLHTVLEPRGVTWQDVLTARGR